MVTPDDPNPFNSNFHFTQTFIFRGRGKMTLFSLIGSEGLFVHIGKGSLSLAKITGTFLCVNKSPQKFLCVNKSAPISGRLFSHAAQISSLTPSYLTFQYLIISPGLAAKEIPFV